MLKFISEKGKIMKTKAFFITITLIIFALGGLIFIPSVKAITDSVSNVDKKVEIIANFDQEINAEDLGVKAESLLLPDSRFYPLKIFWRKVKMAFTLNPIKKVKLQQRFSNEKLIETVKVYEKNKNPEQAKKLLEKYSEDVELIAKRTEKIQKNSKNQADIGKLLDDLMDHLIKRQKIVHNFQEELIDKLPSEKYEKIEKRLNKNIEQLGVKIAKLEKNEEVMKERFIKIAEKQKGSELKIFKNLEVLKKIEEELFSQSDETLKIYKKEIENLKAIEEKMISDIEKKIMLPLEKARKSLENIGDLKDLQKTGNEMMPKMTEGLTSGIEANLTESLNNVLNEEFDKALEDIERKFGPAEAAEAKRELEEVKKEMLSQCTKEITSEITSQIEGSFNEMWSKSEESFKKFQEMEEFLENLDSLFKKKQ